MFVMTWDGEAKQNKDSVDFEDVQMFWILLFLDTIIWPVKIGTMHNKF